MIWIHLHQIFHSFHYDSIHSASSSLRFRSMSVRNELCLSSLRKAMMNKRGFRVKLI